MPRDPRLPAATLALAVFAAACTGSVNGSPTSGIDDNTPGDAAPVDVADSNGTASDQDAMADNDGDGDAAPATDLDPGDGDGGDPYVIDPASLRAATTADLPIVGAAVDMTALAMDADYAALLAREVNQVTPENVFKWEVIHPTAATWDFAQADALVAFAEANQQSVRGHALVWHQQLPAYVASLSANALEAALAQHITTAVDHFEGHVVTWDVVNEAIGDDAQMRPTVFYNLLGAGYIASAFRTARAADSTVKLAYNDYNIEVVNAKSDAVYTLLASLKADGVPIDVVGMQFHVNATDFANGTITGPLIRQNIQRFAALGLEVHITELDVRIAGLAGNKATRLAYQQDVYHTITRVCVSEPGCSALTTWGITDRYSWIDAFFGPDDPLLFDDSLVAKPAFTGVRDALQSL